jgi:hypothetical protein
VVAEVERFRTTSGMRCSVRKLPDGFGPDRNIYRSLRPFRERVLYCAGDVLFHPAGLDKYRELDERFPDNPLSLYHSYAHPMRYESDYAVLNSFAFETLLFNPANYFDYCLFTPFVMSRLSTTDWLLNWLFHKRGIRIYSDRFSYIQHLGIQGGNTSKRYPPVFAMDYIDQPGYFRILDELGIDVNICKMVKV